MQGSHGKAASVGRLLGRGVASYRVLSGKTSSAKPLEMLLQVPKQLLRRAPFLLKKL